MGTDTIFQREVISGETILASADFTSDALNLDDFKARGFISAQLTTTGTGTAQFDVEISLDGVTYTTVPMDAGIAAGTNLFDVTEEAGILFKYFRFKVTEDGTANPITATLIININ